MVNDEHFQLLADRLAGEVVAGQLRPNTLTRYGESRSGGALATAAAVAGAVIAACGVYRRVVSHTDLLWTERLFAQSVAVVAAGHPPDQRLDEVEGAFAPLREARDDGQPAGVIAELLPAYLGAWQRAR